MTTGRARAWLLFASALAVAGCSDLRGNAQGGDASAPADGATSGSDGSVAADAGGGVDGASGTDGGGVADGNTPPPVDAGGVDGSGHTGPGPYGALPTGYCCASNDDCRARNCVTVNGGKMCSDPCSADTACQGVLPGYSCVGASQFQEGQCMPTSGSTACTPADQFVYGTKTLGQCCTATHDGRAGTECIGGRCDGFGDVSNPYICTNACAGPVDCPGAYDCVNVGTYSVCAPQAMPYTCN